MSAILYNRSNPNRSKRREKVADPCRRRGDNRLIVFSHRSLMSAFRLRSRRPQIRRISCLMKPEPTTNTNSTDMALMSTCSRSDNVSNSDFTPMVAFATHFTVSLTANAHHQKILAVIHTLFTGSQQTSASSQGGYSQSCPQHGILCSYSH